jgi:hypothetical protein
VRLDRQFALRVLREFRLGFNQVVKIAIRAYMLLELVLATRPDQGPGPVFKTGVLSSGRVLETMCHGFGETNCRQRFRHFLLQRNRFRVIVPSSIEMGIIILLNDHLLRLHLASIFGGGPNLV